jgi:hypothetical protein
MPRVVGTSTYPSIPNTAVNVMRPKRPSWTSPLAKANRPSTTPLTIHPTLHHVRFNSLLFQIHHPCLRRELPCSIYTPANLTSRISALLKFLISQLQNGSPSLATGTSPTCHFSQCPSVLACQPPHARVRNTTAPNAMSQ